MSTDERVSIRLHDRTELVGQIVRRTKDGLVLDTGRRSRSPWCARSRRPPPTAKRDRRDRRLAACAHTIGHRGHCLTEKPALLPTNLTALCARHASTTSASSSSKMATRKQHDLAQTAPEQRITRFEFVGIGHLTTADAYLAAQAAARAREHRELAREALCDHRQPTEGGPMRTAAGPADPPITGSMPVPRSRRRQRQPILSA